MKEIKQNIEISGVSQITYGYDDDGGHTVEVFHIYEDTVPDPRDYSKTVKAKILCTIDSNDSVCYLQASKEYAPCDVKRYGNNHTRQNMFTVGPTGQVTFSLNQRRATSDYTPNGVYCPNKMTVLDDGSYEYKNTYNKESRFSVDSIQSKNTKQLISSLRDYCIDKTNCNLREIKEREEIGTARSVDTLLRNTLSPTGTF